MLREKKLKRGLTITLLLALVVAVSFMGCRHPGTRSDSPEKFANQIIEKITDELVLDADQQEHLNTIKEELIAQAQEMKESRGEIHAEVIAQLKNDVIDQEHLKALVAEKHAKMENLISLFIDRMAEFHSTLSPAQKDKLIEHLEDLEKLRKRCPFNKHFGKKEPGPGITQ